MTTFLISQILQLWQQFWQTLHNKSLHNSFDKMSYKNRFDNNFLTFFKSDNNFDKRQTTIILTSILIIYQFWQNFNITNFDNNFDKRHITAFFTTILTKRHETTVLTTILTNFWFLTTIMTKIIQQQLPYHKRLWKILNIPEYLHLGVLFEPPPWIYVFSCLIGWSSNTDNVSQ